MPPATGRWRSQPLGLIAAVAVLASFIGFAWTLGGHFLGDDFGYIGRFFAYPFSKWPQLFVEGWAGETWGFQLRELRPVAALSFMIDARLWEANATGYRLVNLALHTACAALVGVIAFRASLRDLACGLAAAALFALHPVHAEPVQWITGRVDVLATLFYLTGFLLFLRYRSAPAKRGWLLVSACYLVAVFSKEFGLTLPIMFLAADVGWLQRWRQWRESTTWKPYLGCLAVAAIYFFCRRAAFGGGGMGAAFPDLTHPQFQAHFAQRQLTYVGQLFPPLQRWWFEGAPVLTQHGIRVLGLVVAATVVGYAAWRWGVRNRPSDERRAAAFFALGWYLVATLPLVVTYISPRHLYLASAGVCVALALVLRGVTRLRVVFGVLTLALLALFAQRLSVTMKPWHAAAVVSGKIARELGRLDAEARTGGALFLDVPEITAGAYVWTWAVPFALRPPFTRSALDERMVVLESRGLYVDWDRWHEQPAIGALKNVQGASWILQANDDKPAHTIPVAADRVRAAAAPFAASPLKQFPHESWRKLITDLTTP